MSTIHADKASSIPSRMYSLLETNQDIEQFLKSIHRYVQLGVYIRGYQDKVTKRFVREIAEVTEFYVTEDNEAKYNEIYKKTTSGHVIRNKPSKYLLDYLDRQGVILSEDAIKPGETTESREQPVMNQVSSTSTNVEQIKPINNNSTNNIQKMNQPVNINSTGNVSDNKILNTTSVESNISPINNIPKVEQPINQPINSQINQKNDDIIFE